MSQRTIIEFNHDYVGDLRRHPEVFDRLLTYLSSGGYPGNEKEDFRRFGITILRRRHHSETVTVEVS